MNKQEIFEIILKSSEDLQKNQNDYFSVAQLGAKLIRNGFDYSEHNYKKLLDLLLDFPENIEMSNDEVPSKLPYAKIITNSTLNTPSEPIQQSRNVDFDRWGIVFNATIKFQKLKEIALKEEWHYGIDDNGSYPILENYLLFTFKRLKQEGGKIFSNEEYAVFDTGLVDKRYDSIYAIFTKNPNYETNKVRFHEWILSAFAPETDRYWGLILGDNFNPLPKRANYFSSADQMYYDSTQNPPTLSDDHIIIDNIDRFPVDFLEQHLGTAFDIRYILALPDEDKEREIEIIREHLKTDNKTVMNIRNRLKDAIEIAVKRVTWNFKTAIPLYFVRANTMSLLLPLALDDNKVDIALVVTKMKAGGYRGMTILTLEQAYTSARLVSRPDSDWLIAKEIKTNI